MIKPRARPETSHQMSITLGQTLIINFKAEPQPTGQETLSTTLLPLLSLLSLFPPPPVVTEKLMPGLLLLLLPFLSKVLPLGAKVHTFLNTLSSEEHGTDYPRGKLEMLLW